MRPKQWIKNFLVFAAPFAAGEIQFHFLQLFLGFLVFCFVSSFGYLINDWVDRDFDKLHSKKKNRLFASGKFHFRHLILILVVLMILTVLVLINLPKYFSILVLIYLSLTLTYSLIFKNMAVVELVWISIGFVIRAVAGSLIIRDYPTGWFLTVIFFGSLFVVTTKRLSEVEAKYSYATRVVLEKYSADFLRNISTAALSVTLVAYSLWAFETYPNSLSAQISVIFFVLILFFYKYLAEVQGGESPEDLLIDNQIFKFLIAVQIILIFLVVYT